MSSSRFNKPGPNFVPAFQISGVPYVTSSFGVGAAPTNVKFPYATRFFQLTNLGDTHLRIGFTANGVNANPASNAHYLIVSGGVTTERLELRCKELFVRTDAGTGGSFSLIAGLTGIEEFPVLSGSNEFKGVG